MKWNGGRKAVNALCQRQRPARRQGKFFSLLSVSRRAGGAVGGHGTAARYASRCKGQNLCQLCRSARRARQSLASC